MSKKKNMKTLEKIKYKTQHTLKYSSSIHSNAIFINDAILLFHLNHKKKKKKNSNNILEFKVNELFLFSKKIIISQNKKK